MERRALDLTRYQGESLKPIERDTAALVIESSGEIHSFFLALLPDGAVVNSALSKTKDVSRFYSNETRQSRQERIAGLKIKESLINEPEGTVCAWVSPPGGEFDYKEARFEIGRVRKLLGFKVLQSYGIPLRDVSPEYCEKLFLLLEEFSTKHGQKIDGPENLRDKIVVFVPPGDLNWLEFLKEVFPELSKNFEKIERGDVHRLKMKALKDAKQEVEEAFENRTLTRENLVYVGARIERGMQSRGWDLSDRGCGLLNSDLLNLQNRGFFGIANIVRLTVSENSKQILKCVKCPFCERTVDAEVYGGKIHCPKCGKEA